MRLSIRDRHGNENIIFNIDKDQVIEWIDVYSECCDEHVRVDMNYGCPALSYLLMQGQERITEYNKEGR